MGDLRAVTEADGMARDVAALLDAIRENTDATKRLVDELVRERQERKLAQRRGQQRSADVRRRVSAQLIPTRDASQDAKGKVARFLRRHGLEQKQE